MAKDKQKQLLTEVMNADAKDGLYHSVDSTKMVTAVDWLTTYMLENFHLTDESLQKFEQAKQMEKEQIARAYQDHHNLGHLYGNNGELYYKETYESNT